MNRSLRDNPLDIAAAEMFGLDPAWSAQRRRHHNDPVDRITSRPSVLVSVEHIAH
jgi:PIN domain nuclease of toxin-antitoxin system